ncbi:MAG TPA: hypothetical protein VEY88_00770, partial [Archangium sp.]|nr:hypothetical protein [Archangium sp.]
AAAALLLVPSGLHTVAGQGHRPAAAAAVAAWMALWWFTEAVPMAWTALLPLLLFPALDVFDVGIPTAAVGCCSACWWPPPPSPCGSPTPPPR